MATFQLKHNFSAGELSPLMHDRVDFDRYQNGCRKLENMLCATQGPAVRRPGFEFVYDLNRLGIDTSDPRLRLIPFVFNELQAYAMVFFKHTDGTIKTVFATTASDGTSGLVVYGTPPITECPPGTAQTYTPGDIVTLTMPTGWDIDRFDWAQSGDQMYIAQPNLPPHIIKRWGHECWEIVQVTFTSQPQDWSDANGWPERVTFHQQRIAFAANRLRRQTVWLSKAGDFSNFGVSSPLADSDAVTFTLDSGTQNRIQWMVSGKSLYIGTMGNEWTVEGNDRSSLTPSNILARRQTNNGSETNKPLVVGLTTLFIERHGRVINEFVYDYSFDSYKTSDMSILAPHLTEHYSIKDWTYQQTPDSIIWAVREDGVLLGLTYQRQHKVVGWHRHNTQGEFKAITEIPGTTREDDVWVGVKRVIDGNDKYYLEKLADLFKAETAFGSAFTDSYKVYDGAATRTVGGFEHLAGAEVDVLANGTVHPPVTVSSTGTITLNNLYTNVVAGLRYISEVRPYLAAIEGDRKGTSLGRVQRITNVVLDFYRSLGGYVGRNDKEDGESEEEIPFRVPADLLGQGVRLYTGWYRYSFPEGFDREAEYFIRQKQPLPMVVRGVVDEIEVYD